MPHGNAQPVPVQPRALPPIHSASLLQGPAGVSLHLRADGGAMTQVPLTLAALREIAALAGSALATAPITASPPGDTPPQPGTAPQTLPEDADAQGRHPA